jgi:hypothetical protein
MAMSFHCILTPPLKSTFNTPALRSSCALPTCSLDCAPIRHIPSSQFKLANVSFHQQSQRLLPQLLFRLILTNRPLGTMPKVSETPTWLRVQTISKAHALDCDFLVGLHAVVPADVPAALTPFAVDHQRLAMLFEIALSELVAQDAALLDKAHVLPPIAAWDEVHKSANATLIFLLVKIAHKKSSK